MTRYDEVGRCAVCGDRLTTHYYRWRRPPGRKRRVRVCRSAQACARTAARGIEAVENDRKQADADVVSFSVAKAVRKYFTAAETRAVDEIAAVAMAAAFEDHDARWWALGGVDFAFRLVWNHIGLRGLRTLTFSILYANHAPGTRRKTPLNVQNTVAVWKDILIGLSTSHDHAGYTAADHDTDEALGPLLVAPVAQIREFATELSRQLREDARVPFMVWSAVERALAPLVAHGKDSAVVQLRTQLATEIAGLAEKQLDRGELVMAIAGALQWRGEGSLRQVKSALESGGKPRVRGRESCLFLDVEDAEGKNVATVVL
jgi:hypothetical protein